MYVVYRFVCTFHLPVYVKTKDILSHLIIISLFCEVKFRIYNILFSLFFDITVFFRFFVIISAALLPRRLVYPLRQKISLHGRPVPEKKPLAENISAQGLMDHIASIVTSK